MIHPVPKPAKRGPKERAPRKQKTRMKQRNARRKGSSFPKQRDGDFCRWLVTENNCLLHGRTMRGRLSLIDVRTPWGTFHHCWPSHHQLDPAHVGKHRSQGAPDLGATVPLCRAAHQFYDEHRIEWAAVTGYTERKMAHAAAGYALAYVERGGTPEPR